MQPDQLVLPVDALNNGTPVNETFTRYQAHENRVTYIGDGHFPDARNTLALYRSFPTKSGNFKGTSKTSVKFTLDQEVAGVDASTTLTSPLILEVSFSVPVGVATADLVKARQRVMALLDNDTVMNALNAQLMI